MSEVQELSDDSSEVHFDYRHDQTCFAGNMYSKDATTFKEHIFFMVPGTLQNLCETERGDLNAPRSSISHLHPCSCNSAPNKCLNRYV